MINIPPDIPPEIIPDKLLNAYTMNGQVKLIYSYLNQSKEQELHFDEENVRTLIVNAKDRLTKYYGYTDYFLYIALDKYSIKNSEVAVIGSINPWYESIVLSYGGCPTTIEYRKIISETDKIKTMLVDEYVSNPIQFDNVLSVSSIEHCGLGRYGDPLDPDGDLKEMVKIRDFMLKSDGYAFISVPIGLDQLFFNLHRVYGQIRIKKLFDGFEIVDQFGVLETGYQIEPQQKYQPVFVLRKK